MKKFLSVAVLFLAGIFFVNAQTKHEDKEVSKMMYGLQQACRPTADQTAKLQPIVQSFVDTRVANKQKYGDDKVSLKAANETNRKNYKASLETVLSADQMKQYEQYVKDQKQARKAQRSGGAGNDGSGGQQ